mmetsp:Transcript_22611/g.64262  ORF Transcript_22611/g.64262 Transcript_22611/m.64262 type:complete len:225 (+) Transcript_22611:400-1074(+)
MKPSGAPRRASCSWACASCSRKSLMSTGSAPPRDASASLCAHCLARASDVGRTAARELRGRNASARCARCLRQWSLSVVAMTPSNSAPSKLPSLRTCSLAMRPASPGSATITRGLTRKCPPVPTPTRSTTGTAMLLARPRDPCSSCHSATLNTKRCSRRDTCCACSRSSRASLLAAPRHGPGSASSTPRGPDGSASARARARPSWPRDRGPMSCLVRTPMSNAV